MVGGVGVCHCRASWVSSSAACWRRASNPDIIAERARSMEMQDAKPWDKILAPMLAFGSLLILIVAGADKGFTHGHAFTLE
ncbi:MAG: hypothetical protein MZU91_01935 [Desulfosudis oleivorans]|nr:hypothetical protein [Desulfosudis oleivorans]